MGRTPARFSSHAAYRLIRGMSRGFLWTEGVECACAQATDPLGRVLWNSVRMFSWPFSHQPRDAHRVPRGASAALRARSACSSGVNRVCMVSTLQTRETGRSRSHAAAGICILVKWQSFLAPRPLVAYLLYLCTFELSRFMRQTAHTTSQDEHQKGTAHAATQASGDDGDAGSHVERRQWSPGVATRPASAAVLPRSVTETIKASGQQAQHGRIALGPGPSLGKRGVQGVAHDHDLAARERAHTGRHEMHGDPLAAAWPAPRLEVLVWRSQLQCRNFAS